MESRGDWEIPERSYVIVREVDGILILQCSIRSLMIGGAMRMTTNSRDTQVLNSRDFVSYPAQTRYQWSSPQSVVSALFRLNAPRKSNSRSFKGFRYDSEF